MKKTLLILAALTLAGCHSRMHTTWHYDANGEVVHKDRTRAYSLFGKSEASQLRGGYDYAVTVAGKTNLAHSVSFGVDSESKSVDADGLKAGGGAAGALIGEAAKAVVK